MNGSLTPLEIVKELDKYIVGQGKAKRAIAIAVRNRWRRQQLDPELRDEVAPKNIIMIGPTGVGKTEIAKRLAKLVQAPFLKVEAVKFTEVGYIGKDVESMIRDLIEISVKMLEQEELEKVKSRAKELAEERVLDLLVPSAPTAKTGLEVVDPSSIDKVLKNETKEKFRSLLRNGKLDERMVDLETTARAMPVVEVIGGVGLEEMGMNIREMFSNLIPKSKKTRRVTVKQAQEVLAQEEAGRLIDMDQVIKRGIERAEQNGIIFLDEIDKIAVREGTGGRGPDVSREGVQRDILPVVEGCSVNTKYGMVRTDHILFIAAGAFHMSKPSDLMPELQGRFPIRVELNPLTKEDFLTILKEPKNSLTKQYKAMIGTEGVDLEFTHDAMEEIAGYSAIVNERTENIGARRLQTIMESVLEEVSFDAPTRKGDRVEINSDYVRNRLKDLVKDVDLSRYIL